MTVVVTGVSSFVGYHVARHFASRGDKLVATISRPRDAYTGIAAERLAALEGRIELAPLDLRDDAGIAALIQKVAPSLWIHHAGFAEGYASADYDMARAEAINVAPLEALYRGLAGGHCGVIVTGSSAEYGESESASREDDTSTPSMPYGLSKRAETLRAGELAERHGVATRVARLFIPFGHLDNPAKLVAQTVRKLRAGLPVALSPCRQRRDFVGVSDVCDGYEKLQADFSRTRFDVFNIASGRGVMLKDFLVEIARRLSAPESLLQFGAIPMRAGEPAVSYADIGKAERILKFSPTPLPLAIERELLAFG